MDFYDGSKKLNEGSPWTFTSGHEPYDFACERSHTHKTDRNRKPHNGVQEMLAEYAYQRKGGKRTFRLQAWVRYGFKGTKVWTSPVWEVTAEAGGDFDGIETIKGGPGVIAQAKMLY